jgi:YVTN family beta-propeller protein
MPIRTMFLAAALSAAATAAPPHGDVLAVERRIPGPDGKWDYVSFDPARGRIYVARTYGVMVVDATTGAVTDRYGPGDRTHAVTPIPGAEVLLTTNGGDDSIRFLDATTGALVGSLHGGKAPDAAVYDPATRQVWVMNHGSGDISVVDPASRAVVATVTVGGALESAAVDGRGRLFVNEEDRNDIAVVDTLERRVVGRYRLAGCEEPTGLALAADRLVAACRNRTAVVVAAASGKLQAALRIGSGADAVAFDPVRRRAYVPTGEDGVVWSIDLRRAPSVLGRTPTQAGARTAALDAAGRLYLPAAHFGPPPGPGQRPAIAPGSFVVLVARPQ